VQGHSTTNWWVVTSLCWQLVVLGWRVSTVWHELGMTGLQKRRLTACPYSSPLTNRPNLGGWREKDRGARIHECAHCAKSRDGGSWTPTAAPGGAAGEVHLDSLHRTTGVAYRRCSRQRGRGGASWGRALIDIFVPLLPSFSRLSF